MGGAVLVNPFRCRVWDFHDRIEEHITPETCRAEIESISKHGQLIPALGRPLEKNDTHDIEIIYGARRLFVAQHLNKPLLVEVRKMTDREAIVAMDVENRHRQDISPYERGLSYATWLRCGYFESQEELARHLKISASQVSRLLRLARLPSVVVGAFRNATELCESWGLELADALEDSKKRRQILDTARRLQTEADLPAKEIYRQLVSSCASGRKVKPQVHDVVVSGKKDAPLFRVRYLRGAVALLLPAERTSRRLLDEITISVKRLMEESELEQGAPQLRTVCSSGVEHISEIANVNTDED